MRTFKLEQSIKEIDMQTLKIEKSDKMITSHAGLALVGRAIHGYTSLTKGVDALFKQKSGTPMSDVIKSYIGILAQGKHSYVTVENVSGDRFFKEAMGLKKGTPSEVTLRTRLKKEAATLIPVIDQSNVDFLVNRKVPLTPLWTGHIALDIDVTPHDNSKTQKEHVSRTYKGMDGYAPIASYIGQEGWAIGYELRAGSQHSQSEFIYTLERNFDAIHRIMKERLIHEQALLVRLDSGHDAAETRAWLYELDSPLLIDLILKWNPRKEASAENKQKWYEYAQSLGHHVQWSAPRKGKQVATFSIYVDEKYNGKTYTNRRVMQITKRSIDKEGQQLLLPKLEIEGWWTTLDYSDQEILALYRDHATSEQFHSEFKTDLDLERLPSQSFDGNDLVLSMGVMVYNILRWIGLAGLMEEDSPVRHTAKRRRIRTVLQEMIYVGAQLYEKNRFLILRFGKSTPAFSPFQRVYQQLAYG
jgi:hypothetical protein